MFCLLVFAPLHSSVAPQRRGPGGGWAWTSPSSAASTSWLSSWSLCWWALWPRWWAGPRAWCIFPAWCRSWAACTPRCVCSTSCLHQRVSPPQTRPSHYWCTFKKEPTPPPPLIPPPMLCYTLLLTNSNPHTQLKKWCCTHTHTHSSHFSSPPPDRAISTLRSLLHVLQWKNIAFTIATTYGSSHTFKKKALSNFVALHFLIRWLRPVCFCSVHADKGHRAQSNLTKKVDYIVSIHLQLVHLWKTCVTTFALRMPLVVSVWCA